jgi:hypothetical protein
MSSDPTSLDRLHDIVAPPPAPWWPTAPGWYWLFGILLVLVIVLVLRGVIRWQKNRYRREALTEWRRQSALLNDASTRVEALTSLSVLLKRTALSAFPRNQVAAMTGAQWCAFLRHTIAPSDFNSNGAELLERVAYGDTSTLNLNDSQVDEAASFVRQWIVHHRVDRIRERRT